MALKFMLKMKINPIQKYLLGLAMLLMFSLNVVGQHTQTTTGLEYFFDTDPGAGNGTQISGPNAATGITIPNSLSAGFHTVYFRAKGTRTSTYQDPSSLLAFTTITEPSVVTYGLTESRTFLISNASVAAAPTINAKEYFFDTDPGAGSGTALSGSAIMLPTLSDGFHTVYIRARYDNGQWGLTENRTFFISNASIAATPTINAKEYFFDTDPGAGSGIAMTSSAIMLPSGLSEGFHTVYFRARYNNNQWGLTENRTFFISNASITAAPTINAKEYFFDTDPGAGSGTALTGSAITLPTTLSEGFHVVYIRTRYDNGQWGLTESRPFYIKSNVVEPPFAIDAAEYFFDTDPGAGSGTAIPVTSAATLSMTAQAVAMSSCLTTGTHRFYMRVRSSTGKWSLQEPIVLTIEGTEAEVTNVLVNANGLSGFPCNPSASETVSVTIKNNGILSNTAAQQAILPGQASVQVVVTGVNSGTYTMTNTTTIALGGTEVLTISGVDLNIRGVNSVTATVTVCADANASNNSFTCLDCNTPTTVNTPSVSIALTSGNNPNCSGGNVTYTATPTNAGATPSYQWKKDGSNVGTNSVTYVDDGTISGIISCVITSSGTSIGACSSNTAISNTIAFVSNTNTTPTFNLVAPICAGATLNALPTTSLNGLTGSWSPALNNAATTVYTFAPTGGQCAVSTTLTITVNPLPTITGISSMSLNATTTLAGSVTPALVNPWMSANTSVATVSNVGVVTGIAVGTCDITYTNDNGCTATTMVNVNTSLWDAYAVVGNTYYDLLTQTGNIDFQGANLGTYTQGSSLLIQGGEIKTRNIGTSNMCGGKIWYAIYPASSSPSGFNAITLSDFICEAGQSCSGFYGLNNAGEKVIAGTTGTTNILQGLAVGNYKLAVYVQAVGSNTSTSACDDPLITQNNLGANWVANFTVTSSSSCTAPIVSAPTSISACQGTTPSTPLSISATGTGTLTYQWFSNSSNSNIGGTSVGSSNGGQTNSYTPPTTATSYYYCEVTDACDVTKSAAAAVNVNPLPSVPAITAPLNNFYVLVGGTLQLSNTTSGGLWSSVPTSTASISSTGLVTGVAGGSAVINYQITNGNGCVNSATATVTILELPLVDIGIFNVSGNNDKLVVKLKPLVNITGAKFSGGVFTVRFPSTYNTTLSVSSNTTPFSYAVVLPLGTNGGYDYYRFSFSINNPPNPGVTWIAGNEYTITTLQHNGSCVGAGTFEIINDVFTNDLTFNGGYYQELNGNEVQNNIYQATATIPCMDLLSPTWTSAPTALNTTVQCSNASGLLSAQALLPIGTDNCSTGLVAVKTAGTFVVGSCPQAGSYTNTFTLTDACGNVSAVYTQVITIIDNTAPTWTSAPTALNTTIECSDASGLLAAQALLPTGTDNCSTGLTAAKTAGSFVAGSCPQAGTYTNTFTLTDACGNVSAVYTQVITIIDNTAPTWTSAPTALNTTVQCSDASGLLAAQALLPIGTDNCSTGLTAAKTAGLFVVGSCPQAGSYTNTFTLTDACGNVSAVYTQVITIIDNTAPTWISTPTTLNTTVQCSDASGLLAAQALLPTGTDNCSTGLTAAKTAGTFVVGSCPQAGTYTNTFTLTDACGNVSAVYTQVITIIDNTTPTWTSTPTALNTTLQCSDASGLLAAQALLPTGTDNCSTGLTAVKIEGRFVAGSCPQAGTYTNTFTLTDACGNESAIYTQVITIIDNTAPTWTSAPTALNTTVQCSDASGLLAAQALLPTGTDNCSTGLVAVKTSAGSFVAGSCPQAGSYTNTFTLTDACGNVSAVYTQVITIIDNTAPTWTSAPTALNTTIQCSDAVGVLLAAQALLPVGTDNCSTGLVAAKTAGSFVAGSCPQTGTYTNTFTLTDACGNVSAVYTQVITIIDNTAPTWTSTPTALNTTVQCSDASGLLAAQALLPIGTDNCSTGLTAAKTAGTFVVGSCPQAGTYTNTFTLTDACGNVSAVYTQIITIIDNTVPTWTSTPTALNTTVQCSDASGLLAAQALLPIGTDNCSTGLTAVKTATGSFVAGSCPQAGSYTNTFTLTDACGNVSAVYTQVITIIDNTAPTWTSAPTALNTTVQCSDASGLLAAQALLPIGTDNCSTGLVAVKTAGTFVAGSCPQAGSYTNTFTLPDACGNVSAVYTQVITIIDNTVPIVTAPPAVSVLVNANSCSATGVVLGTPIVTDNCTTSPSISNDAPSVFPLGNTTVTWSGTDACGNIGYATQVVTVTSNLAATSVNIPTPAICTGESTNLSFTITGGASPYTVVYNVGAGDITVSGYVSGQNISVSPTTSTTPTIYTYSLVSVTDAYGCVKTSTLSSTLTVNPLPILIVTQPAAVCVSLDLTTVVRTVNVSGGVYSYHATLANATAGTSPLSSNTVNAANTYYVRYTLPTGCFTTGGINVTVGACVEAMVKVILQGPYNTSTGLMKSDLRTLNLLPTSDPYSAAPFATAFVPVNGGGVKTTTTTTLTSNAIVDWVFLELRNKNTPTQVLATRSALLQNDGDIVDMDGTSPVKFNANLDRYFIAVRHRNHLGVMTQTTIDYAASMSPGIIDFSSVSTAVYAKTTAPFNRYAPRKVLSSGVLGLWAGDVNFNGQVKNNGTGNDGQAILIKVGVNSQLSVVSCYCPEDANMNGQVKYNGSGNDRLIILNNVGVNSPLNIIYQHIP
jgi:Bacterial Ig-like domain (group 2)